MDFGSKTIIAGKSDDRSSNCQCEIDWQLQGHAAGQGGAPARLGSSARRLAILGQGLIDPIFGGSPQTAGSASASAGPAGAFSPHDPDELVI